MKKSFLYLIPLFILVCLLVSNRAFSQDIPERPVPQRLVTDLTKTLNQQEINALERKLVAFNDSTSTQIAIVIVPTLNGYEKSDYAQRLGEKWGIGQKGRDNGVLILVKPKTPDSGGEVFIAPGYGLEGVLPDIVAAEIIDYEMLPSLREGDYYGALEKATNTVMAITSGEFSAMDYNKRRQSKQAKGFPLGLMIMIAIILIAVFKGRSGGGNNRNISSRGLPLWLLLSMMGSGRGSHSGSWGGFSGGGGGGGGFGGFGGGGFGGGGAGGSW